jgi:hypothetical protein
MANVKRITADYGVTGHTVYAIIRREADKYLLNDADGSFGAAPADPFLSLSEDGTIKGRYEVDESRTVWNDGTYDIVAYNQVGVGPVPAADTMVAVGIMSIVSDAEIEMYNIYKYMATTANLALVKTVTDKFTFMTIDAVNYPIGVQYFPSGAVITDTGNSGLVFKTDLTSAVTNFWKGAWCLFTTGALAYQPPKRVTSYDATEKKLSFTDAFTSTPAAADVFSLIIY